ncbi:MAG: hypothetical protein BGN88_09785 [Clostridiales bacterium 43-6]|nr:MAG: hypothetical protein BGN88_09785 [Clostridiales bacterium 43-6]
MKQELYINEDVPIKANIDQTFAVSLLAGEMKDYYFLLDDFCQLSCIKGEYNFDFYKPYLSIYNKFYFACDKFKFSYKKIMKSKNILIDLIKDMIEYGSYGYVELDRKKSWWSDIPSFIINGYDDDRKKFYLVGTNKNGEFGQFDLSFQKFLSFLKIEKDKDYEMSFYNKINRKKVLPAIEDLKTLISDYLYKPENKVSIMVPGSEYLDKYDNKRIVYGINACKELIHLLNDNIKNKDTIYLKMYKTLFDHKKCMYLRIKYFFENDACSQEVLHDYEEILNKTKEILVKCEVYNKTLEIGLISIIQNMLKKMLIDEFEILNRISTSNNTNSVILKNDLPSPINKDIAGFDKVTIGDTIISPISNEIYELMWIDNFDEQELNKNFWSIRGTTSNECQANLEKNITIENSQLIITAKKEDAYDNKGILRNYTGCAIHTKDKVEYKFGRFEMYAKIPFSQGMWSAFWTLGTEDWWPWGGEINIMEIYGGTDEWRNYNLNGKYGSHIHWCPPESKKNTAYINDHKVIDISSNDIPGRENAKYLPRKFEIYDEKWSDDYRVYGIEWTNSKIVSYVDNQIMGEVSITNPEMRMAFFQKHHIILTLATVNNFAYPGAPDSHESTEWPQKFMVDWVKVWQIKKEE